MSESDPRELVEAGYDLVAERYAALESSEHEWPRLRWLRQLLSEVERGARILDVGCGNGIPATREIAKRHQAVGVDISGAQIQRAKANVPEAEFVHGDLSEIDFSESFAAIAAFYVIEHLPRQEHAAVFQRFHRWLDAGGHLLFTIEPDDEPGKIGEWLGQPMYFSQHDAEMTLGLVREAGFEVLRTEIAEQLEGDRAVTYMWVLAQRA